MMHTTYALSLLVAASLLAVGCAGPAHHSDHGWTGPQSRDQPPLLQTTGHGEIALEPDQAVVRLGATAQAEAASQAQQTVNQTMQEALGAIRGLGIAGKQIRTVELSLQPVYEQREDGRRGRREREIVAYQATSVVEVTVAELAQVGDVIDAATQAGVNRIENLSFELADPGQARQEALDRAVRDARQKARTMADASGVRLLPPFEIVEGSVGMPQPRQRYALARAEAADAAVEPGQITISADVTVRFEISPDKKK